MPLFGGLVQIPEVRGEERVISKDGAPVAVVVIPTNEELMIAKDTMDLVRG